MKKSIVMQSGVLALADLISANSKSATSIKAAFVKTTLISAVLVSTDSYAQNQNSSRGGENSVLDEVIVTASRREESLSDVAISVSAFTKAQMDQRGVRTVDDIARMTPGVTFARTANTSAGITTIAIRGIRSSAGSATTGIYIDDTPIQTRGVVSDGLLSSTYPAVFDLERVEILRGPQGTLFGAGSMGGTVRFITPEPSTSETSLYARSELAGTASGDMSYEAGLAVGTPLVEDRVGLRLSGWYRRDGGYIDRVDYMTGNTWEKDGNWKDSTVLRGTLAFNLSDRLSVMPSFYYQDIYYNDNNSWWEDLSDSDSNDYKKSNPLHVTSRDKYFMPSIKIDWEVGDMALTSNTSYFDRKISGIGDLTTFELGLWAGNPYYPAGVYAPFYNGTTQENFTQEIRLQSTDEGRLSWLVGAFYQHAEQNHYEHVENRFLPDIFFNETGVPFDEVFPGGMYLGIYTVYMDPIETVDEQLALFGELNYYLTDKLRLTAGLRYADTSFDIHAAYQGPIIGPKAEESGSQSDNPLTPKLSISYDANENTLLYGTLAKGYRAGGYNVPVPLSCGVSDNGEPIPGTSLGDLGLTNRPAFFEEDSVWSYEFGAKSTLLGGRLRLDASIYQIDWENIQLSYTMPQCGFEFITNAGNATSQGFDLQLEYSPVDDWTLAVSVGYNKAEYDDTVFGPSDTTVPPGAKALVSSGDRVNGSPLSYTLSSRYDFQAFGYDSYARFDYDHHDGQSGTPVNLNAGNGGYDPNIPKSPDVDEVSLRIGFDLGTTEVSLFVNNLLNEDVNLQRSHAFSASPLYTGTSLRPRTVGVTLVYRN